MWELVFSEGSQSALTGATYLRPEWVDIYACGPLGPLTRREAEELNSRAFQTRRAIAVGAVAAFAAFGVAACSNDVSLKADKDRTRQEETADTSEPAPEASVPADGHEGTGGPSPETDTGTSDNGGVSGSDLPGFAQGVPADWPGDVPVPDGASNVFSAADGVPGFDGKNGKALVMEVSGNPADASAQYKSDLIAQGWQESPLLGMSGAALPDGGIVLQKDGRTLMAFPTQASDGRSQMMVMIIDGDLASLLQDAGTPPG